MVFRDRFDAGRQLADKLLYLGGMDVVVLGLPRGGVPVAFEVARSLGAPLDVIVVRKLGVPFQPELAMGAIGENGVRTLNPDVVRAVRIDERELAAVERRERAVLEERAQHYRANRPLVPIEGRTAVVVDDGIATGATARAACQVARAHGAARVVLAVPVAPRSSIAELVADVDELVCLETPESFDAVGQWYQQFSQVSDAEVLDLLDRARTASAHAATDIGDDPPIRDEDVTIGAGPVDLAGHLTVPEPSRGVVIFAHGSGSSRNSPRNRFVAATLNAGGLGTLLFDLLTSEEELDRANVFDIGLLASRLGEVTRWLRAQPEADHLPVGYFGASTGAAAALLAAAQKGSGIRAVVSRGGRPDLAPQLEDVRAPTLLIVGGDDRAVLALNRDAQAHLRCVNELTVVPGATHLFEEPGALEVVAGLSRDWFATHLAPSASA